MGLAVHFWKLLILSISFVHLLTQHMVTFIDFRVRNFVGNSKIHIVYPHGISTYCFLTAGELMNSPVPSFLLSPKVQAQVNLGYFVLNPE